MSQPTAESDVERASALAGDLRVLVGKLKRRLRDQANLGDLTLSQISVLHRLERDGPATVTTLARAEGMRSQSMGTIISALETAGLVIGSPDPTDGRQTLWALTPTCREWVVAARAARQDWLLRAIQTNLNSGEQEQLADAVNLLQRIVDAQ